MGGLDRAEIAALAGVMLGEGAADERLVDQLQARTGGRALYLCTLLSEVPVERLAQNDAPLTSPSLAAAIQEALAAVPLDARALIEALAVLNAPVPLHVAAGPATLNDVAATRALDPLLGPDWSNGGRTSRPPRSRYAIPCSATPSMRSCLPPTGDVCTPAPRAWWEVRQRGRTGSRPRPVLPTRTWPTSSNRPRPRNTGAHNMRSPPGTSVGPPI